MPAQQDRLDQVSRFVVTAPMCEKLGMKVDPVLPDKVEAALKAETSAWSTETTMIDRLKGESIQRQSNVLKVDLATALENAKTDAQLRQVAAIFRGYGRTCLEATRDRIFSQVITAPLGFDLDRAATEVADTLLEAGGLIVGLDLEICAELRQVKVREITLAGGQPDPLRLVGEVDLESLEERRPARLRPRPVAGVADESLDRLYVALGRKCHDLSVLRSAGDPSG
ncbi:hypothetical protein GGQ80_003016 [Sphingomonas jinjuensis]|uniref:Uncharacterized protein n=1 Tax=Sphingomonas jinjuensis TaxID=535907 RepID=A0A840FBS4_9SPHN|nr:hypothetical protein [Sphingomonas jinjuensis]MBB4155099.1 hypothetical protein [Sphingomonas jinjuensis]